MKLKTFLCLAWWFLKTVQCGTLTNDLSLEDTKTGDRLLEEGVLEEPSLKDDITKIEDTLLKELASEEHRMEDGVSEDSPLDESEIGDTLNDNTGMSCPDGCFKSGFECFRRLSSRTTRDEASQACAENDLTLAEPEEFQALAEYLYNTKSSSPSYWIGLEFGPNNDTVQWASGGELQNPPWYPSNHHSCHYEHLRIGFSAKGYCHTDNWCLYCSHNKGERYGTFPLCECKPIYAYSRTTIRNPEYNARVSRCGYFGCTQGSGLFWG